MLKTIFADCLLFLITIGWGYTYIAGKKVLDEVGEFYFLSLRFFIGAGILLLFQIHRLEKLTIHVAKQSILCGVSLGLAFYCQLMGLKVTTPGTAGVITGLFVVIVPFLYFLFSKKPLQTGPVLGSLIAFTGLFVFSYEDTPFNLDGLGEIFLFFAAIFFAVHIVLIDRAYRLHPDMDGLAFAFAQLAVVGFLFIPPALIFEEIPLTFSTETLVGFTYNLIVGTVIAYSAQTILQKYSPPTHVSLIFSFESVFAFLFSWKFYGEIITTKVLIGVGLMLCGIFVTELLDKHKFKLKGKFKVWQFQRKQ
jgi:drug/metabolite transporter (DMT)-like permease